MYRAVQYKASSSRQKCSRTETPPHHTHPSLPQFPRLPWAHSTPVNAVMLLHWPYQIGLYFVSLVAEQPLELCLTWHSACGSPFQRKGSACIEPREKRNGCIFDTVVMMRGRIQIPFLGLLWHDHCKPFLPLSINLM